MLSGYDERDGRPKSKILAQVKTAHSRADVQLRAEWSDSRPGSGAPEFSLNRRLSGPQSRYGDEKNLLPKSGI